LTSASSIGWSATFFNGLLDCYAGVDYSKNKILSDKHKEEISHYTLTSLVNDASSTFHHTYCLDTRIYPQLLDETHIPLANTDMRRLADHVVQTLHQAATAHPGRVRGGPYHQHGLAKGWSQHTRHRTYYTNLKEFKQFVEDAKIELAEDSYDHYASFATIDGGSQFLHPTTTVCLDGASDQDIAEAISMVQSLFVQSSWVCPDIVRTPVSGCPICSKGGESLTMESSEVSGFQAGSSNEIKRIARRTMKNSLFKLKELLHDQ
jgi:hypothetical protein